MGSGGPSKPPALVFQPMRRLIGITERTGVIVACRSGAFSLPCSFAISARAYDPFPFGLSATSCIVSTDANESAEARDAQAVLTGS